MKTICKQVWKLLPTHAEIKVLFHSAYVKVKWSCYRPVVAQRVGIVLLFHDLGTRRGWVVSSMLRLHFTPRKTRYPFYRRLGGPQGRYGLAENLVPTGIRSWTIQPAVSHYTDWATRPTLFYLTLPKWRNSTIFRKDPAFRPCVPVRATCRGDNELSGTGGKIRETPEGTHRKICPCQYVGNKSHTDRPGIEPGPPQWEAGHWSSTVVYKNQFLPPRVNSFHNRARKINTVYVYNRCLS